MQKIIVLFFIIVFVQSGEGQVWKQKVSGTGLGNPLAYNPLNTNILYGCPGNNRIYVSRNRGYSWTTFGNAVPAGGMLKSIYVNPLDTSQFVVGVEMGNGFPDRILKSTNAGVSWTETWGGTFSYYGKPVEFELTHPDTMYTMGNDTIWRSTNFGTTWDTVRRVTGLFNSWCDAEIRPDSGNIIYLGDNSSGIWKTTDYGVTWKKVYSTTGEIPSIAIDPFNPQVAYATKFSGGGGVVKTTDGGESWQSLTTPAGFGSTWWITTSTESPGYVYFGTYGANPPGPYMSRNSGTSWTQLIAFDNAGPPFSVINYGMMALDTLTVIALQNNGIWKLQYPQSIMVTAPNDGEYWNTGSHRTISWTSVNVGVKRIEYSTNAGSGWMVVANNISAGQTSYDWVVPNTPSTQCRVRITDSLTSSVSDTSDSNFTIYQTSLVVSVPNGHEVWMSGTQHQIAWTSEGPVNTDIDVTTDNGSSWTFIATAPAAAGSYLWTVPNSPSGNCRIRLRSAEDSAVTDQSDSVFTIRSVNQFACMLHIADNGAIFDSLKFGANGGATDSIDAALGETVLPPKPSKGSFDARWRIGGTDGARTDIRDTIGVNHEQNTFVAEIQPGSGGYPFTFFWNPESLGQGEFFLRDEATHGNMFTVNMKTDTVFVITDTSVAAVEILHSRSVTVALQVSGEWNLVSLPVSVADRKTSTLFPFATSTGYSFNAGYQRHDTLNYGVGYWLKTSSVSITGGPRDADTIDIQKGWNIIGSISFPVAISSIVAIPDTLIASSFYGYAGGYSVADTIMPGSAYWVKAKSAGQILMSKNSPILFPKYRYQHIESSVTMSLNELIVSDGRGHGQSLYFGEGDDGISEDYFELPPVPPSGAFDVRFGSQSMVERHPKSIENGMEFPISLFSKYSSIIFTWRVENEKNFLYILRERIGPAVVHDTPLRQSGSITQRVNSQSTFSLRVSPVHVTPELPESFTLHQNYPNPFNPSTEIRYDVPYNAAVKISVYSMLGQVVTHLVDAQVSAGTHSVMWNGTANDGGQLSGGVYFAKMVATSDFGDHRPSVYSTVIKMILMK